MSKNHPKIYTKSQKSGYGYNDRDLALLKTWPRYWQKDRVKDIKTTFTCTYISTLTHNTLHVRICTVLLILNSGVSIKFEVGSWLVKSNRLYEQGAVP